MKGPDFRLVGLEKLGASTEKDQSSVMKHADPGAEQQRFADIMGDEESRLPESIAQVEELSYGLMFAFVPVVGTARHWYRFERLP